MKFKPGCYLLMMILACGINGCSPQQGQNEQAYKEMQNTEWTEMEVFHDIMSETYHPMEEGNFEPLKLRANELAEKATDWASSAPPADLNTLEVKALIKDLSDSTRALAAIVTSKANHEIIKQRFDALHDQFHEVIGKCKKH